MSETSILDAIKGLTAQFHELRAEVSDLRNQSKGVGCPDDMDDPESCPDDTDSGNDVFTPLRFHKKNGYHYDEHGVYCDCSPGLVDPSTCEPMYAIDYTDPIAIALMPEETSDESDDSDDDQDDSDGNQIAVRRSSLDWVTFKALLLEECEQEESLGNEREGWYGNISHHRREEATDDPSNLEEVIDAVALFINLGVLPGADRFAKYE